MKCSSLLRQVNIRVLSQLAYQLLTIFILSACATVEKHQLPSGSEISKQAAWEVHRANIQSIQTWRLKGRVAGKSDSQGFRAGVQWNQFQHNFVIDLHGPLGRKVAVIASKQGSIQLKTSKGESFDADDPEELMQSLFGYSLPVNGLRHWLLGIPDPKQAHTSLVLDEQGRLKQLKQAGWLIEYKLYHDSSTALPALIKISNPTLNANIKVDRWMLGIEEI